MNLVIVSKKENLTEGANRICHLAIRLKAAAKLIDLDNISKYKKMLANGKHTVYFLTNNKKLHIQVERMSPSNVYIINREFIINGLRKYEVQEKLKQAAISIPKHFLLDKFDSRNINAPLLLKSNFHVQPVHRLQTIKDFTKIIKTINHQSEWYLEEAIDNNFELKKFYYVSGFVTDSISERSVPKWVKNVIYRISEILELEVFSTDLFINRHEKRYFCIDVNPASTFFHSSTTRAKLIEKFFTKKTSLQ